MADRKPLKVLPDSASGTGGGDSTGIGEFVAGDTLGVVDGGTGLDTVATSNILTGNGTSALSAESNLTFDGTDLAIGNAAPSSYMNSVHGLVVGDNSDLTNEIVIATTNLGMGELNFTDSADTTNQAGVAYNHDTESMLFTSMQKFLFNETANAKMTQGITINQAANDNEILALKSSDVAHGMTDMAETDTYGTLQKTEGTGGGITLSGYTDADITYGGAVLLSGTLGEAADTTKSSVGYGVVRLQAAVKSSASRAGVGSDGNLVTIDNLGDTRFIFDAEGTGHADVGWTTYSDARLKKNIEIVPYGLDEVLQLEPKIFDKHSGKIEDGEVVLEDNGKRQIGFLAQDVKALMPELVAEVDDSKSFYSLSDGKLAAVLVRAIQELNAKLEAN